MATISAHLAHGRLRELLASALIIAAINGFLAWRLFRSARTGKAYDPFLWLASWIAVSLLIAVWATRNGGLEAIFWFHTLLSLAGAVGSLLRIGPPIRDWVFGAVFLSAALFSFVFLSLALDQLRRAGDSPSVERTCLFKLKMLAIAMHACFDVNGSIPRWESGDPPMSWRVALLPYLEQQVLYRQYDPEHTWDSAENLSMARMPQREYLCPIAEPDRDANGLYFSSYAIPVARGGVQSDGEPMKLNAIPDGGSRTLLVVEAIDARIVWTEPRDIDAAAMFPAEVGPEVVAVPFDSVLSSRHPQGAHALFADGSTRTLSSNIAPAVLKQLIHASDGEPTNLEF